jgi:hypothetical protein
MSKEEEKLIQQILEDYNIICLKCTLWDLAAEKYKKRGMCGDCFYKYCVSINSHHENKR